ncbi:uncharacterized protein GLRG_00524 [Colletotrichum graminicola M1.001]|uniref:DUF202 domain-containing protein n=1 Tax=Colletotrichum graminicola (strain M1.001 / M2 / FGSC 10212) TaxID=645133 RepID=E3Q468_COLGM|nr:uncharacterized protein GLRG_00524 [Colletotrichum graminicola M1.001]EFQ25380.1 hypothetical protein GLRG_00524 [Colletotrichum graminicola M1.001]
MQPRKEQEDARIGQPRPQPQSGHDETTKEETQTSATGPSAHGPASTAKLRAIRQFWGEHASVVVDFDTCRDHLVQLFAIQPSDSGFGYAAIGKPLDTACYCFAMCVALLGALRVWRIQHVLLLGKTLSGRFEIMTIAAGCLMLSVVFIGFSITLDIVK